MQAYLREFLYWVCRFNFEPVVSKIGTTENDIADFLSRNYDESDANAFFQRENLPFPERISISESSFHFIADW